MKGPDAWEEISSVKGSVTSGVSRKKPIEGSTGVLEEQPIEYSKTLTLEHVCERAEMAFEKPETSAGTKEEKGEALIMDPRTTKMSAPLDYSASVSDTISLVGKGSMMAGPSPGDFMPQTTRVDQMKLEAPPMYSGKKQPSVQT